MKKILLLLLFAIVSCTEEKDIPNDLLHYIPQNPSAVLMTNDLQLFINNAKNNNLIADIPEFLLSDKLTDRLSALKELQPKGQTFISLNEIGKDNFEFSIIARYQDGIIIRDSAKTDTLKPISYQGKEINVSSFKSIPFYSTTINNIFIGSSSKLLIENAIRVEGASSPDKDFMKLYDVAQKNSNAYFFIDHKKISTLTKEGLAKNINTELERFGDWTAFDATIDQNEVMLNGLTVSSDSLPNTLNLFKDTRAKKSSLSDIIPLESDNFTLATFSNYMAFNKNRPESLRQKYKDSVFNSVSELADLSVGNKKAVILFTEDPAYVFENFQKYTSESNPYRDIEIYKLSDSTLIRNYFGPLVKRTDAKYAAQVESYFIFSNEKETIETVISNYQNGAVIVKDPALKDLLSDLADASSILWVANIEKTERSGQIFDEDFGKKFARINTKSYKYAAFQFIAETNYAHFNAILKKKAAKNGFNVISQVFSTSLNAPLLTHPQFVINHRTKQKEIVVQDDQYNLYLISAAGKVLWKKKLNGKIQGDIEQIDMYRNGRLQLAFVTTHSFYTIDRNGNDVSPFPINFENPITQPLAVFDYDNNKKYRFPIIQGSVVNLYNKEGKQVNGFQFTKANSTITAIPKHFRIGAKDYLVFKEEDGSLHILHRTGKTRINVKEKINFSNNNIFDYEDTFTTTTAEGELYQINQAGKITRKNLGLKEGHAIDATAKTLVTLSENVLTIKGKKVALDYGLYTAPKIFYIYNKIYVGITDTQSSKVYVFDSNAKLLPNFPVYGNSMIDLNDIDNDRKIEITVEGEEDTVLLYSIN